MYEDVLKNRELEIMKSFHSFCECNELKYVLAFGTMIGCVRHQGFIPWDDDIDVVMPYSDFLKFNDIAPRLFDKQYFIQNHETDSGYNYPFTKIRLKHSCAILSDPPSGKFKEHGIYIDIFPAMFVPSNIINVNAIRLSNFIFGQIARIDSYHLIKNSNRGLIGKAGMMCFFLLNKLMPQNSPLKILYKNAKSVNQLTSKELYIGDFYSELNAINDYRLPIDVFEKRKLMKFEDTVFYMPIDYDTILKKMYGAYMELPPKEQRKSHGFIYVSDSMSYHDYKAQKTGD